jgi:molecular chaperone DnaJ
MANAGLGNKIVAVQQAEEAARLEPDNPEYQNFLNQLQYAGTFYRRESQPYPHMRINPSIIFLAICLLQSFCFGCRGF